MTKEELRLRLARWYAKEPWPCEKGARCPEAKTNLRAQEERLRWNEEFNQILRDIKEMSI